MLRNLYIGNRVKNHCISERGIVVAKGSIVIIVTPIRRLLIALACAACLGLPHSADALSMRDPNELGYVEAGLPSGNQDRTDYLNALIALPLGNSAAVTASGQSNTITRSLNDFGSLAPAAFSLNGTGTSIDLGTIGYAYLLANYNGPKFSAEIWYVGGLNGTINIPQKASSYNLIGWTLFAPGESVPDGGTTVALLGAALGGLGIMRRLIKR